MGGPVASAAAIEPGTTKRVTVDGVDLLVCNVGGSFYCVEDVCTHDGGTLDAGDLDGVRVMCPRHGAFFDVTTGKALTLPAISPLPTYPVRVEDGEIYIDD